MPKTNLWLELAQQCKQSLMFDGTNWALPKLWQQNYNTKIQTVILTMYKWKLSLLNSAMSSLTLGYKIKLKNLWRVTKQKRTWVSLLTPACLIQPCAKGFMCVLHYTAVHLMPGKTPEDKSEFWPTTIPAISCWFSLDCTVLRSTQHWAGGRGRDCYCQGKWAGVAQAFWL